MQDFNSFSIIFYYLISTTYQKIGDLFCPVHISGLSHSVVSRLLNFFYVFWFFHFNFFYQQVEQSIVIRMKDHDDFLGMLEYKKESEAKIFKALIYGKLYL